MIRAAWALPLAGCSYLVVFADCEEVAWYRDADGDGHGIASETTRACWQEDGWAAVDDDCDDTDATVFPGADETCDGRGEDCDGLADEDPAQAVRWALDGDGDGYGSDDDAVTTWTCEAPEGAAAVAGDCDDTDATVFPGADETCDGRDEDCDGLVDEEASDAPTWYRDADGDGWGDPVTVEADCAAPEGMVADAGDCNDTGPLVFPGAPEECENGADEDCDGLDADCGIYTTNPLSAVALAWYGRVAEDAAGSDVAGAGDVDGDGVPDLVVGAYGDDEGGLDAGAAFLLAGPVTAGGSLADAQAVLVGALQEMAGSAVAGDVDADGFDDVLVGACGGSPGRVTLLWGPLSGRLALRDADTVLAEHDGGFGVRGAVDGGGDLDADGYADLVLGSPGPDGGCGANGRVTVVFGPVSGQMELSDAGAVVRSAHGSDCTGRAVTNRGDLDGDGVDDLVVGAPEAAAAAGQVFVFLVTPEDGTTTDDADAALSGGAAGERAGYALSAGGDVDGDGMADLLVGGPQSGAGRAWLVDGPVEADGSLDTAAARFEGGQTGGYFGFAVSNAGGDVDADGFADLLLGAPYQDGVDRSTGAAYLFTGPLSGTYIDEDAPVVLVGEDPAEGAGIAVDLPGDVDGDGFDDILVGAQGATESSAGGQGAACLVLGHARL